MTELQFFNTLGRRVETLEPAQEGHVRVYTCGPTVYNDPHIGNLRTFMFEDLLRRTLVFFGYRVTQVMNLTDVEDKIIARACEQGVDIATFTQPCIDAFFRDLDLLGIERVEHYPKATEHIDEMIELIERLIERDFAYLSDGSVFFRISSDPDYGKLSGIDLQQVRRGERVADDEYGKDDARDFVLWKGAKPGEPAWPSPWGEGRPGWHVECSAMSERYLGPSFDIHCGGVDNIFPHHENEIAQSESANDEPFVRYWLHAEHLLVDGEKMSKSLGNQYTLAQLLERGIEPRAVRYLLLTTHYRKKLNFTFAAVEQAAKALHRFDEMRDRVVRAGSAGPSNGKLQEEVEKACVELVEGVRAGLADDLNMSIALRELFNFVRLVNGLVEQGLGAADAERIEAALAEVDAVFGFLDPVPWQERTTAPPAEGGLDEAEVERLVAARTEARASRDFQRADEIRDQLASAGVVLEDGADGTRWKRT